MPGADPTRDDLAFETDLLYIDVANSRIGINTATPSHDLQVDGTTRTTNLETDTQAKIATFTISGNTIASSSDTINLLPDGATPVVYQAKVLVNDNLQLSTNAIQTTALNSDLEIKTNGSGQVNINSNVLVTGSVHATGTITADGNLTLGSADNDSINFKADIDSNIIPNINNFYDLGSNPVFGGKEWQTTYTHNVEATNVTTTNITANNINLVLPQGNIVYVATTGNDLNAGLHEHNPVLTVKHALSLATGGTTVFVYPGTYIEEFPLVVPVGVNIRGAGIRAVNIKPTPLTRYNDAFLLNGETTIEDITVSDFFSGKNIFNVDAGSSGTTTINVGTAPFAHTYVSGGTIEISGTSYTITNAVYSHTTGILVLTHTGGTSHGGDGVYVSNLTFSCNGGTRVFPDNGYAFRFAPDILVTSKSPYIRNVTVITKGSTTSPSDPYGFDAGDAGKGAYIDGAYAHVNSNEAAMLFHAVTFITPNVDTITATNGARIEWLNSFTYFANKGMNLISSNEGFANQGQTALRLDNVIGTFDVGDTVDYYDAAGTTVLASGTIAKKDADGKIYLTGKVVGFDPAPVRVAKSITANGDAKLSTSVKKWGSASLALDGTGDYAFVQSSPDFQFGTGEWCVEAWVYNTATTGSNQIIFDFRTTDPQVIPTIYIDGATNHLHMSRDGLIVIDTGVSLSLNTWTHIAVAKSGTSTKFFKNGTQAGSTYTDTNNYIQGPLTIGSRFNFTNGFNGYIDDVRISKGTGRYTSNFTAPSAILPNDIYTVFLSRFDGANNATTFVDEVLLVQDVRSSSGGTSTEITLIDYSDFGVEVRAIGSADVYGNYGVYGDGPGVIAYLVGQNFAYIGAGKRSDNDNVYTIQANEVVELNDAKIYYSSVDQKGNFRIGDLFYVNQADGSVQFTTSSFDIQSSAGITFTDGTSTTTINGSEIDVGNFKISGNTIETVSGSFNVLAASDQINFANNVNIAGNLDVTGNVTIAGNIQVGNQTTDTVSFVAEVNSNIIPSTPSTYNLGAPGINWNALYTNEVTTGDVKINTNVITTTGTNEDLSLQANGTGKIVVPNNNVQIDQNLTVNGLTTLLTDVGITGTVNQTGAIEQTGDYNQTGNTDITGNLTVSTWAQFKNIRIDDTLISTQLTNTDLQLDANGTGKVIVPTSNVLFDQNLTVNGITSLNELQVTGTVTANAFTTGDILIDDNYITTTISNHNLELRANGTGKILVPSNNVEITNNLTVTTGLTSLQDTTIVGTVTHTGTITQTGDYNQTGDTIITGNLTVSTWSQFQNIRVDGQTISTTVTNSDLQLEANGTGRIYIPTSDVQIDQNLTVDGTISAGDITVDTTITSNAFTTGDILIDDNYITTTISNHNLELRANGLGKIQVPSNDVQIDQNLTVETNFTVTTGTSYLKNVGITGTITQTGDINQTGNFTSSGTSQITGDVTATGYLQVGQINLENNIIRSTTTNTDLQLLANGTGSVIVESIKFTDNNIQSIALDSDITLTPQGLGSVIVNSNQSLQIPVGTSVERPNGVNGRIRYNTTLNRYEGYNNGYWLQLSGVIDHSGNTRILAEASPGANNNVLYFYANNVLTTTIDSTKLYTQQFETNNLNINNNTISSITTNSDLNITTSGTGGVNVGNMRFYNNTITNTATDSITIFDNAGSGYFKFSGTNAVVIPSGDTGLRPVIAFTELGMLRYNTELAYVEIFNGTAWVSVAGTGGGVTFNDATELALGIVLALG